MIALLGGPYFGAITAGDPAPNGSHATVMFPVDIPASSPTVTRFVVVGGTYLREPLSDDFNGWGEVAAPGVDPMFTFDDSGFYDRPVRPRYGCRDDATHLFPSDPRGTFPWTMIPRPIIPHWHRLVRPIQAGSTLTFEIGSPDAHARTISSFWALVFDYGRGDPDDLLDETNPGYPSTTTGIPDGSVYHFGYEPVYYADNGGLLLFPLDNPFDPLPAEPTGDVLQLIWTAAIGASGELWGLDHYDTRVHAVALTDPVYEEDVEVFDHQTGSGNFTVNNAVQPFAPDWIADWSYRIGGGCDSVQWPDPGANTDGNKWMDNRILIAQGFSWHIVGGGGIPLCDVDSTASLERVSFSTVN